MKLDVATAKSIIDDMYEQMSLKKALANHGVEAKAFYLLMEEVPLLANNYSRAREHVGDAFAEEIVEIADTESDPQKARNRIDARRWIASKYKPNTYGDRIDLNVTQNIDLVGALKDAKERTAQVIDIQPKLVGTSTGLKTCDELDVENEHPSDDFAKLLE